MANNRWDYPDLGFGIGLRSVHFEHILKNNPTIDWFEVLSENYMDTGGRPLHVLDQVAERYPVVLHGVSLNVGSTDPIDFDFLKKLKALAKRVNARWVSDHLCWTGVTGKNTHDLLPMPYTDQALRHTIQRVREIQDFMERPIALENASTYLEFSTSKWPESEFISALAEEADCGILLDVNNVYVSSFNHGFDPKKYIDRIPKDRLVQMHLAGHTNKGTHILDTHSDYVIDKVWDLYRYAHRQLGGASTLLEWDANIPAFDVVHGEALKARRFREEEEKLIASPELEEIPAYGD
ncbi:MAG TPA: DUF692 domain-containing protein [Bryobacteraceae bacterium]|nr:DUF692 domain-containing protein [Bryobacteraceae bacterium]